MVAPKRPKNRRRRKRSTNKRGRRMRPTPSISTSTFGRAIATGVKTLISYLPGSTAIQPIADFILKAVGLSTSDPVNGFMFSVTYVGLGSKFLIGYSTLIASTRECVLAGINETHQQQLVCAWREVRLIEISITIASSGPIKERQGEWTLAFYPFYTSEEEENFTSDTEIPDKTGITRVACATTSSAGQRLSLTYRPRVVDGFIYHFHDLKTKFGGVAIRFSDYSRANYGVFTSEKFSMERVVKGKLELRSMRPDSNDSVLSNTNYVTNVLKPMKEDTIYLAQVLNTKNNKVYSVEGNRIRNTTNGTSVIGNFYENGVLISEPIESTFVHSNTKDA